MSLSINKITYVIRGCENTVISLEMPPRPSSSAVGLTVFVSIVSFVSVF